MKNCLFLLEECSSAWLHWTQGISSSGIDIWSLELPVPAVNKNIHPLWPVAQIAGDPAWRQTRQQQKQTGPKHRLGKLVVWIKPNSISPFWICHWSHLQCQQLVMKAEDLSPKLRLHHSCQRMPRGFHCSSKSPSNPGFLTNPSHFLKQIYIVLPSLFVLAFEFSLSVYRKNTFC